MKQGVDKLANAVKVTIGPKGRNAVLDKGYGAPTITNDGVSIAKEIELEDKIENIGAEIIKEVASKTNDVAGDGTTTAIILAQAIISEGLKNVTAGANPLGLKRGLEKGTEAVVAALKKMSKPVSDSREDLAHVATISAEDKQLGEMLAKVYGKVGKDGVVTIEESQAMGVYDEMVEGMQFDKGYVSAYLVTNAEKMIAEYNDPYILITDKKISAVAEIVPILEAVAKSGKKEMVIIAEDIDGEALATLIVNKLRGTFNTLAIKAPGFGDRRKEMLQDIAVLTGGEVISEETGKKLDSVTLPMLGRAGRVVADKESTTIVDGKGKKGEIEARVKQIQNQLKQSDSEFDREKYEERLAKLSGGVAIIKVGAATEVEMKAKKDKLEDAKAATKAAMEEGIVPGGGVALVRALDVLKDVKAKGDVKTGVNILKRALEEPLRQIAENAGKDGSVVVEQVKKLSTFEGYNALEDKYEDLLKAGVIDPTKVTRSALQNAVSAAAMFLTTEVVITDIPEAKGSCASCHPGGAPGGMDMGM